MGKKGSTAINSLKNYEQMKELEKIIKKLGFKIRIKPKSKKTIKVEKNTENLIINMVNISHQKMTAPYDI